MKCYICDSKDIVKILDKKGVPIWTNSGDRFSEKIYKCVLCQCNKCGCIFQPISKELKNDLNKIYFSNCAQFSTLLGEGRWGSEMAKSFMNILLKMLGDRITKYKSALEIGCGNDHILRALKSRGFVKLVGIDPSLDKTVKSDGITLIKKFIGDDILLSEKYDLILSFGVFEHVENINQLLVFCKNNIEKDGELFLSVPNSTISLRHGDPGLFAHQHVHYFTEDSIEYLLNMHGFGIKSTVKRKDSINICAKLSDKRLVRKKIEFFYDYQSKVEKVLDRCKTILRQDSVLVHGVCNTLNNVLGWTGEYYDFTMADNDDKKHGKKFFNRRVHSLDELNLSLYSNILVTSYPYFEEIKSDYVEKGFKGDILKLIN